MPEKTLPSTGKQRGRGSGGVTGRGFRPGVSGNPTGRPKASFDFAAAAREHTPEVLAMFLRSIRSANWRERHSAGTVLLDRALGKPTQLITGGDGDPVTILHLVAVREVGERIVAELAASGRASQPKIGSEAAVIEGPPALLIDLGSPAKE